MLKFNKILFKQHKFNEHSYTALQLEILADYKLVACFLTVDWYTVEPRVYGKT